MAAKDVFEMMPRFSLNMAAFRARSRRLAPLYQCCITPRASYWGQCDLSLQINMWGAAPKIASEPPFRGRNPIANHELIISFLRRIYSSADLARTARRNGCLPPLPTAPEGESEEAETRVPYVSKAPIPHSFAASTILQVSPGCRISEAYELREPGGT